MSKPVLKASKLAKTYGVGINAVEVLKAVDLELSPAEKVVIVGSSGSGKSTLLHLLGGLDTASAGEVELAGQLLNRMSPKELDQIRNERLGFVYPLPKAAKHTRSPSLIIPFSQASHKAIGIDAAVVFP